MKVFAGTVLALTMAMTGCQGGDEGARQEPAGGGGGPAPSPSVLLHGQTGGPGDYGGPAMGGMDPDGIGPGSAPQGGGGGLTASPGSPGQQPPTGVADEDPNVNPINQVR